MTARRKPPSIRSHLLGIVLLGAVLPLALIGLWLSMRSVRNGKDLLDRQLTASLQSVKRSITARWAYRQSDLMSIAENEAASHAVTGKLSALDSLYLEQLSANIRPAVIGFTYRDITGQVVYSSVTRSDTGPRSQGTLPTPNVHFQSPIQKGGVRVGVADVNMSLDAVLPVESSKVLVLGSTLSVRNRMDHTVLARLSGTVLFPTESDITVNGEPWSAKIDSLLDPPLDLAVGAPTGPYVTPYENAGRIGLSALIAVAILAVFLTNFMTARLARSVGSLVDAADAVAGGDLQRQVDGTGPAELHRLAGSFNTMTESLRGLVAELSQRRALAAVGEFAASLSHEVRNALTAVQIDLERVDERTEDTKNRVLVSRALGQVRRLDAAVTGSLRIARSGSVAARRVDLNAVVDEAIRNAEPSFVSAGGRVTRDNSREDVAVNGDGDALQQLFLNLLLNAQQALSPGGNATITIAASNGSAVVSIADTGSGMTAEQVSRAFDLHYTTRPKGTGLGLPIARQIAIAHGGRLTIESTLGVGTRVEVELPRTTP